MRCLPEISINCDRHHGMPRRGSHYLHHGWGQPEFNAFVPQLWWADEAEPPHRRYLWLQRTAHIWLQSMRGVWVTEGSTRSDQVEDTPVVREWPSLR